MVEVVFKYRDAVSRGEWREQSGTYDSVEECIEMNGLGDDCEFKIISVTPVD